MLIHAQSRSAGLRAPGIVVFGLLACCLVVEASAAVPCTPPQTAGLPAPYLRLMNYRLVELHRAAAGLECSGIPLVAFDQAGYSVAGFADDPGLYLFVPLIARAGGLSIARSVDVFLALIILPASLAGFLGFRKGCDSGVRRTAAVSAIAALTAIEFVCGDVYVAQSAIVIATIPWVVWVSHGRHAPRVLLLVLLAAGIAAGLAGIIRSYAGATVVAFTLAALVGAPLPKRTRTVAAAVLVLSSLVPLFGLRLLTNRRDRFLAQQPSARAYADTHPFWHSIYIGLGYWPNRHVARYEDGVGFAKGRELAPDVPAYSAGYERALRDEVARIVTSDPLFAARTLALRFLQVLIVAALSANLGLPAGIRAGDNGPPIGPFITALAIASLHGLLVAPNLKYLMGVIACGAVYGVLAIDSAEPHNSGNRNLAGKIRSSVFNRFFPKLYRSGTYL